MRVFISYRRGPHNDFVGRLFDGLVHRYGAAQVFIDVYSEHQGRPLREVLSHEVKEADVVLLAIDETCADAHLERDHPWVAFELLCAVEARKRILPVLLAEARMPGADRFPSKAAYIAEIIGAELRRDPYFRDDLKNLCRIIDEPGGDLDGQPIAGAAIEPTDAAGGHVALGEWRGFEAAPALEPIDATDVSHLSPTLIGLVVGIVEAEGPVIQRRLNRIVCSCAGMSVETAPDKGLVRAVTALVLAGQLSVLHDPAGDVSERVIAAPGEPFVVPRVRGDRRFDEIPLSEIEEVGHLAFSKVHSWLDADHVEAVCAIYETPPANPWRLRVRRALKNTERQLP